MRSRFAPLLLLFAACWLLAGGATAAVHRGLPYLAGAEALQTLDLYVPDRPGPHPVVVFLHSGRDEHAATDHSGAKAAAFLAQGYVFVSVNYRPAPAAPHPAQVQDGAAALAWVAGRIAEFGGDPGRIHLMGQGRGARLAALLAADARRLAVHGLSPELLRGVMLFDTVGLGLAPGPLAAGAASLASAALADSLESRQGASPAPRLESARTLPPALLFFSGNDDAARLQTEALADHWRGTGASAQLLTAYEGGPTSGVHEFGAAGDPSAAQVFAWLRALQVPRVQRFENLVFEHDGASTPGKRATDGSAHGLVAYDGALYAIAAERTGGARILRRDGADSPWTTDAEFAQELVALHAARPADGVLGPQPRDEQRMLLAFLSDARGAVQVSVRGPAAATWSVPAALSLRISNGASVVGVAHRDAITTVERFFVASTSGPALLLGLQRGSAARPLVETGSEVLSAEGTVLALAVANGVLHASVGRPGSRGGGLYRRIDGERPRWELASAWAASGPALALAAVPDPQGTGREVLLLATARGTMERIDPAADYARVLELDFRTAFRGMWRGLGTVQAGVGSGIVALRHPQSNDLVHALGLSLSHPAADAPGHGGGYYLVRQLDASYSYGLARDFRAVMPASGGPATIRSIVASPFRGPAARAWYFGGDTERGAAWMLRARLDRALPAQGLWWDRAQPGHGLSLHPAGDRWLVTLYTFDTAGEPVWYLAVGALRDGRFVADAGGLARYELRPGESRPQQRDAATSGAIALDFDAAACRDGKDRSDASALATLRATLAGRSVEWCIEPIEYGAPGLPEVDPSGVWFDGSPESGWGMMLAPRGHEGRAREAGIVFFYDRLGDPRWVLGLGELARGAANLELRSYSGPCPGCAPRELRSQPAGSLAHSMQGYCGEVAGSASIALQYPGAAGGRLTVENARLQPLSTQRCY